MRLFARVNAVLARVAALLIGLMMLTVVYDVVARLAFRAPTLWVIDINEYLLVYVTFIPAAWILQRDNHVKVELVSSRLPPRAQRVTRLITDSMGLFYCAVLAWQGWLVASEALAKGYRFSTALAFPQFPVFVIVPLGAAWLGLAFVVRLWSAARGDWGRPTPVKELGAPET